MSSSTDLEDNFFDSNRLLHQNNKPQNHKPAFVIPVKANHMSSQELWVHAYTRLRSCNPITISHLKQTHTFLIKTTPLPTHHLTLSSPHPKNLTYILSFLNHIPTPDLSPNLYNAILQGLPSKPTSLPHTLHLLRHMLLNNLLPDHYTIPSVLKACAQCRALKEGQQVHAYAIKSGLVLSNVYVSNTIMRLYAVCGIINYVRKVFDKSPQRDLVSWTTLIQGYVKMGMAREGVEAFFDMCDAKMRPDEMTLVIVLSACAKLGDLSLGRKLSRYIDDNGVCRDVFVGNALVNMYLECSDAELARRVFDGMKVRNVVSWNSMISGLAHQGKYKEALDVFQEMQRAGLEPDDVTLVGVLNSCANLGVLELGKWVHAYVDRNGIEADWYIGNALVDMYGKCGSIDRAFSVFQGMKRRDVYSYTAMIVGLAMHGEVEVALDMFSDMSRMGIRPDEVTFVGVLAACSHGGLVAEGQKYFRDMSTVYKLRPQTEHYGCMVDLLGRAGLINEAEEFVNNMPIEPDAFVWGALLGACRIHGKVELAEAVMKKLLKVEPERDGAYVLMSNIYSSANKWRDAVQCRRAMKEKNMTKTPGCSSIELEGVVHEFRKGDKSHGQSKHIYKLLDEIMSHIKDYGVLSHRSAFF